jgi:hypothetical protein
MTPTLECHGDPVPGSCFPRDGLVVRTLERVPYGADHEVATAQPPTPVHQSHQPEHAHDAGVRRRPKIKTPLVDHTEENKRLIRSLQPYLQSLVRYHFSNIKEHQVQALNRILEGPICRVETKDGDQKGTITWVICSLCPPNPPPRAFGQPNALPNFAHHFRIVHCGIKTAFKCIVPLCDKVYSRRHDMKRHFKDADDLMHTTFEQRQSDVSTGDVEDEIVEPFVPPNVAGPSNSYPVSDFPHPLARNIASSSSHAPTPESSKFDTRRRKDVTLGSSCRVKPYLPRNPALSPLRGHPHARQYSNLPGPFQSTNGGAAQTMIADRDSGGGYAGPSTGPQVEYMTTGNHVWVTQSSSLVGSSLSQEGQYGRSSHTPVLGANQPATYLHSYDQTFGGVPGGFSPGSLQPVQSPQHDHQTIVPQMSQVVGSGYTMNTMLTGVPDTPFQPGSNSRPIEGSRQPVRFPAANGDDTQYWQDTNGASMSARYAQSQHGQDGYNGIRDPGQGMSRQYSGLPTIPVAGGSTRRTLPRPHETTLQDQYSLQHQSNVLLNYGQQATHPPWGHPQNSTNTTLRPPTRTHSQSQSYSSYHRRSPNSSAKPPRHLGDLVSQDKKTLKRVVSGTLFSWLGSIWRIVRVSGASQSAIPVSLAPPWEGKRCNPLFLSREGEVHDIDLWGWTLRKWRLCRLWTIAC